MSDARSELQARLGLLLNAIRIWRYGLPDGRVQYTVYDEISEKPYLPDAFPAAVVEEMIAAGVPVEDR